MTVTVTITAELPDELLKRWVQYVRNFDTAHEDCHFKIDAIASTMTAEEIEAVLRSIKPPFDQLEVHKKQ